jgi:demethylmenaquinone methyltransferase/2-methoxy-6-polyprenyl-1,4-benzoquinol methylase
LYRSAAGTYDLETQSFEGDRRRVVELLRLEAGDTVVDVGCGTGLCFDEVEERIGPGGLLVGVDLSGDMLAEARARVERSGWHNVLLVEGPADGVELPDVRADALLFCFTHDILRAPAALENLFRHARPGARVAVVGPKWAPWWTPWLNVMAHWYLSRYLTTYEGLDRPWSHLLAHASDLRVEEAMLGAMYFAYGTYSGESGA